MSAEERDVDERSSSSGDVVHGELENQEEVKRLSLNSSYLWGLAISIVIGGQYIGWNEILQAGFGSALISTVLITSGYICLILCMAEMSSAIPFGGGSYGIARVTLGFFPGYMVAFMEASQNIIFVASGAVSFGEIMTSITGQSPKYEPNYWIFFYVSSLSLQICGGHTFWKMIMFMAVLSVMILLVYIFGSMPQFNFEQNALLKNETGANRWFRGGGMEFMRLMPVTCWFYMGLESINLACKDVPNPRVQVPRGYLSSLATLVVLTFAILFCVTAVEPGIEEIMFDLNPLHHHWEHIFHFPHQLAEAVIVPSIYAMCSGFMYCYGKQLKAMAKSGLINPYFAHSSAGNRKPVRALIWGSAISFVIALGVYFIERLTERHLFVLCMLCAFSAYASQFASFIIFRYKFATIKREYTSPLGVYGAVYGFCVFTMAFVGAVAFQADFIAVSLFVLLVMGVVMYYFYAAMDRQSFSEEEKQVMFRAYLMKSNDNRNKRIKKGKAAQVGCAINATHSNVSNTASSLSTPSSTLKYAVKQDIPVLSTASNSASETPRAVAEMRDQFHVSDLGITTQHFSPRNIHTHVSPRGMQSVSHRVTLTTPRHISPRSTKVSHRVKLLVDTGSGRISMTGEVPLEDYSALKGALQDNEDVMLIDEDSVTASGHGSVEVVSMTQDMLLSHSDQVHYNNSMNDSMQFSDIEHLEV